MVRAHGIFILTKMHGIETTCPQISPTITEPKTDIMRRKAPLFTDPRKRLLV